MMCLEGRDGILPLLDNQLHKSCFGGMGRGRKGDDACKVCLGVFDRQHAELLWWEIGGSL